MVVLSAAILHRAVNDILLALETPLEVAERVAASLVESNLVGHDSHGVMRLPSYVSAIRAGTLNPSGRLAIVQETSATVFVDCGWTFGQYACGKAMDLAIDKARTVGVGLAVLRHCDHTGRVGEYVTMAAERGCVGQVICNGSSPGGLVAPFGGLSRALGANPIAWGIPGGEGQPPIVLDFATATAAHGKLEVAADKGELVPEGWILDKQGQPTRRPQDAIEGGAILPFGGHKGYALSVIIELIGGGLSGAGFPLQPGYRWDQGTLLAAINIETFQPLAAFRQNAAEFTQRIKAMPLAPGHSEILLPGELEWRAKQLRQRDGIPLPEITWNRIRDVGRTVGIEL